MPSTCRHHRAGFVNILGRPASRYLQRGNDPMADRPIQSATSDIVSACPSSGVANKCHLINPATRSSASSKFDTSGSFSATGILHHRTRTVANRLRPCNIHQCVRSVALGRMRRRFKRGDSRDWFVHCGGKALHCRHPNSQAGESPGSAAHRENIHILMVCPASASSVSISAHSFSERV